MKAFQHDHLFTIGDAHKVCEDYALSGIKPFPYAIISDGCSGSEHTDIGARILSITTYNLLCSNANLSDLSADAIGYQIIQEAHNTVADMGLDITCLDATLGLIYYDASIDKVRILLYGDGCFAFRINEVGVRFTEVKYDSGAPFYLTYLRSIARKEGYRKKYSGDCIDESGNPVTYLKHQLKSSLSIGDDTLIVRNEIEVEDPIEVWLSASSLDWVYVASDGLRDIWNEELQHQPLAEYAKEITEFKSLEGEFLQKRINRWLKIMRNKKGWKANDDISLAGLSCIEVEDEADSIR